MNDQRAHERFTLWVPVRIENPAGKIEAVCRDGSAGGLLISGNGGTPDLEVGEAVLVTLPDGLASEGDEPLFGRVVRVEQPTTPGEHLRVAIEFIDPVPELTALFKRASSRPPPPNWKP